MSIHSFGSIFCRKKKSHFVRSLSFKVIELQKLRKWITWSPVRQWPNFNIQIKESQKKKFFKKTVGYLSCSQFASYGFCHLIPENFMWTKSMLPTTFVTLLSNRIRYHRLIWLVLTLFIVRSAMTNLSFWCCNKRQCFINMRDCWLVQLNTKN